MLVKIVACTEPRVEGVETAEEFVAYAARVSNPGNQMNKETAAKLLTYLVNNEHWSPLEMVSITMEINTQRDIARQILRHRSFSFQEFSQRYANANELGFTVSEARMQDPKNRQASLATDNQFIIAEWNRRQAEVIDLASLHYDWAISSGIAKEQARKVLPEGLTNSRIYMAGTLRSWLHYGLLRTDVATQKEHREIANEVLEALCVEFPSISSIVKAAKE